MTPHDETTLARAAELYAIALAAAAWDAGLVFDLTPAPSPTSAPSPAPSLPHSKGKQHD